MNATLIETRVNMIPVSHLSRELRLESWNGPCSAQVSGWRFASQTGVGCRFRYMNMNVDWSALELTAQTFSGSPLWRGVNLSRDLLGGMSVPVISLETTVLWIASLVNYSGLNRRINGD